MIVSSDTVLDRERHGVRLNRVDDVASEAMDGARENLVR